MFEVIKEARSERVYGWGNAACRHHSEQSGKEKGLHPIEENYRTLLENFPYAIARYDRECRRIYINSALQAFFDRPEKDVLGATPTDFSPLPKNVLYEQKIREVFNTGKSAHLETSVRTREGGTQWTHIVMTPEFDADGRVESVLTVGRDITDRKLAEMERKANLRFFESLDRINRAVQQADTLDRMLGDVLDVVLSVFDCDRAFLVYPCDPGACAWQVLMERNKPEYPGGNAPGNLRIPMDAQVAEKMRILLDGNGPIQFGPGTEYELPHDISERYGIKSLMAMAVYPKMGKPWEFGIHQCSHTRRWSREDERLLSEIGRRISDGLTGILTLKALRENEESLRDSEEKYRLVVENSMTGVYIIQDGVFRFVNTRWCEVMGYRQEEVIDRLTILELAHPEDRGRIRDQIQKRLDGESGPLSYQFRGIRKDGKTVVWKVMGGAIAFRGRPAIAGTCIDVTQEKNLEALLLHSQKMEAIGTLAGGIAHDFNNILAALMGHTEMALQTSEEERKQHHMELVLKSCERAKSLVGQILAMSRRKEQKRCPIDIRLIVKEVLNLLRSALPATIDIRRKISPEPMMVSTDATWIHQILMNLCTNAAHAMDGNPGVLSVRLESVFISSPISQGPRLSPGFYVQLTVSDTGQGIDPGIRHRVFDPFFTTKEVNRGTGLGLSMVYGLVDSLDGAVTFDSVPGKETTFTVLLPRIHRDAPPLEAGGKEPPLPGGTERILLVDDEEIVTDVVKEALSLLGYRVTSANGSREALNMFLPGPDRFDAVVTDLNMPHMTGLKMAEKMMAVRPGLPVILCTGFIEGIDEEKAGKAGIRKLLLKPFRILDLSRSLREVLKTAGKGTGKS